MDSERWQNARQVFGAALERDPGEWDAFLERACASDGALREEVGALLEAHLTAGRFLAGSIDSPSEEPREPDRNPLAGRRLGSYRLIRRLGRGGMGEVYLAVRDDDEFQKRVAVKVLAPGMGTDEVAARFRTERQILAALDHPNIAKLLDGGTTEEGLPYFVMEYVEGRPIDEYCDRCGLSLRRRLELFCDVCSAVQYAHRNLVVHRDLKPGNILVTPQGAPKLLDFGIAKLLNPELSSAQLAPTATVLRLMTPDYASPEQARGESITTSADVYSLGVLLYYLLTGHRPYRLGSRSPVEMLQVICEEEPETPSTAVLRQEEITTPDGGTTTVTPAAVSRTRDDTPARLHRRLSGDLDNIVLMAMRKEPARRYGSAQQFAEDIRRHLDGRPVLARKDTFGYRLGKLVRRHRIAVAAAALFVMACLGFGVVMAAQRAQISRERDRAEAVRGFLVELFETSDPIQAADANPGVRTILDRGARRLETELAGQPEIQAELKATIGVIYQRRGEFESAKPLLEEALELRRELYGREHAEVAASLNSLADLRMELGQYAAAEHLFREALEVRRRLFGTESVEVAESLNDLGKALQHQGDLDAAEIRYREALEMRRSFLGRKHVEVAETLNNLAGVVWQRGDSAAAERFHREALAIRENLLGKDHVEVSESLNNLAVVLNDRGAFAEARAKFERALALRRRHLGEDHPRVATTLHNLAGVLANLGQLDAAEQLYRQAIDIYVEKLGGRHPYVAGSLRKLAALRWRQGAVEEAEEIYGEAIEILRETGGPRHPRLRETVAALEELRQSRVSAFPEARP
jgi:serine/threonine-protein kinase